MDIEYADEDLCRLEADPQSIGFTPEIARGFRKAIWFIRNAVDERDLYAMKGLHFERLKGARAHQRSMRINKQWRLILELIGTGAEKRVRVIGIEDYH
jgi:proteic killer suppression protein